MEAGDWTAAGTAGHVPVLADEVLELLVPADRPLKVIDGTLGCGGHSERILRKNTQAVLLGIDRDEESIKKAKEVLKFAEDRVRLVKGRFSGLAEHAAGIGWLSADAVLLDVGVSSVQLDTPGRGFSHRLDGPLDMRMDSQEGRTASRILNGESEEELARIFREYGEIREARRLAGAVVERRRSKPWFGTLEFAEFCNGLLGPRRRPGLQAATLCFQALRIAVNGELDELRKGLEAVRKVLAPGGRMAVISFHSLEDRIVKQFFARESRDCICPPEIPVCVCSHRRSLNVLTRKPVEAGPEERLRNRRSVAAKLRAAEKIQGNGS